LSAPQLWTDAALRTWAVPIVGVTATPKFYSEAEYDAARVDELRTYSMYLKNREPKGYRDWMRKQVPSRSSRSARAGLTRNGVAASCEILDGMDLPENRTDDPRALTWVDDPSAAE
jgi:hypothetical protein